MPALKNLGALISLNGRQVRVIARTTYADLMAMTGLSRDHIAQTANEHEVAWLKTLPENALFYFDGDRNQKDKPLPVPDGRVLYRSAKDKRATLNARRAEMGERRAASAELRKKEAESGEGRSRDLVASVLYSFDRHNEEWGRAAEQTRAVYLDRADAVLKAAGWGRWGCPQRSITATSSRTAT